MFKDLPEEMKRAVSELLAMGDFVAAKQVHDRWEMAVSRNQEGAWTAVASTA